MTDKREHLPGCRLVTWREFAKDLPNGLDDFPEGIDPDGGGIMKCVPECPRLARSVERGRELAERFGW